ncbi:heme oxygenase [Corynebacterium kutscheri]|uniref:heme oxygenase (biliverdin-producing) n=1 Tax=Corynebacterium kutscheri TaxID=35755 RepID=A0A0F6TCS0_9CORY|nr:biliverdin-producing heme oxygenase [Corynebacterium kutscheri]AKE40981.1 heme oxygenase [Corynebacterium kutscheri]VEH09279.1 heme oxygenase [Corynebacterium kutscheri]VEH79367.1 heme oxygenase [Corynebacterium kutscheri]
MTTAVRSIAADLKLYTAQAHEDAEHSYFMSHLMEGELNKDAFIALQEQSWFFYRALEEAVEAVRESGRCIEFLDPRLNRSAALEHDLNVLHGSTQWHDTVHALPATKNYVAALEEIRDNKDAPRLIAHHYVRYLGDLSGGQAIGRMMQRHYGVDPEAVSFYDFAEIGKLKPYKDLYREKLDGLAEEFSEEEIEILLAEAARAFGFNHRVFAELEKN